MRSAILQLACHASLALPVAAGPQVNLGYATYDGITLANGVNQFLGMRYAAPPTGLRRFKRPMAPLHEAGVIQAKEHGPICYGVGKIPLPAAPVAQGEDCLFIDIYVPADVNRTSGSGLPVMLWIQGGGFVELFNPNYNGTGIVEASGGKVIVATFNYRVGPYGFLASEDLRREGNLNLGLHDQRAAIAWVQKHIRQFGGDPGKVTLFGTSIGGGSVLLQTIAYGGKPPHGDRTDWRVGIAQAVNIPPVHDVKDIEFQYNDLLNATNCTSLACLRSLGSDQIQAANVGRPFPGQSELRLLPYSPVIDGQLFTSRPQAMLKAGNFSKARPLIIGSSSSEGTLFVPQANTTSDIETFLRLQFPDLTTGDIATANGLYCSVPQTFPNVTATVSPLYNRLSAMYGDLAFSCPALEFAARLSEAGVAVHYARTNILDPVEVAAGYLVPHTWELQAVWGPEYAASYVALPGADSYNAGGINRAAVAEVQRYWTSFAGTLGDPNALREAGSPVWQRYGDGKRLVLRTNATAMEQVPRVEVDRCAFWANVSPRTHI